MDIPITNFVRAGSLEELKAKGRQLHHFIAAGVWNAAPVETEILVQADRLVGGSDAVLVIDDTAIPKKGTHSVGVAAQYASALGKTANCQILVSLTLARQEVVQKNVKYYMPRPRTALRESELIKISIHRLIYSDGGWEKQIGPYSVALFPERAGDQHILSLYVNGQRQQKFWRLSTAPWGNRKLRRNGFVPWSKEERYYIHSSPTQRHQYLYVSPDDFTIGTRPEMGARYDSNCWSKRQRQTWKDAMAIRKPRRREKNGAPKDVDKLKIVTKIL